MNADTETSSLVLAGPHGAGGAFPNGNGGPAGPHFFGYDEVRDPHGMTRAHWQPFYRHAPDLSGPEFTRRWRDGQRVIRENGVTYNVYGDPHGMTRPWQLDPIPFLLTPRESADLEAGLVQRGRLFERILADLYGEQRLLREGLIPTSLVYRNPRFLRPCQGIRPPLGQYLHLYAANLARAGDGSWRVISDRTQAPSGAGYALENRIVVARTLPEAFSACRVQRLATFFQTLITALRAIAPRNKDNPRVVLLTPGPYNETYFEHSYLARYLGYTLAEGGDLTVRDNRVYLKVLGDLQPVDVIFRRLDDDYCDPLELRPDSFLGVPGLMHAVRTGNVAVANAIGSGLVESPAMMAFLPQLCRRLLGEELRLASARTWWCGDPESLRYVLDNLADLVVKPAFPLRNHTIPAMDCLDTATTADRIRAMPHAFVAQERLPMSMSPTLTADGVQPRKTVLRLYLAAHGDSFDMMPGGLCRFGPSADSELVLMQAGGGSKDTWVLTDGEVNPFSLLPAKDTPIELTRGGGDVPSRAADNLFWLGRYAERAESLARLLRCILSRLSERSSAAESPELPALLRTLSAQTDGKPKGEADVLPALYNRDDPNSLTTTLHDLHGAAGLVRDRISLDMWRVVNRAARETHRDERPTYADALDDIDVTILRLAAFTGMVVESMTRTDGWRFLDLGRKIERAMHLRHLIHDTLAVPQPAENAILDAVIEVCDSRMTYRRRYLGTLRFEPVLDLVMFDESNPRSLASQLATIADDVNNLPRVTTAARGPDQRLSLAALAALQTTEVEKLATVTGGRRLELIDLLHKLGEWLPQLSNALTQQYLSHLQKSRHLSNAMTATFAPPPSVFP
ncbi:circularly permuted type 2 ATP-grasp protein [Limnoglobus roseus]|uniref:Circularly permuted type 2 ATP-grasp protein n=1 Tax=Limnoglobus roseus TaxID=2598579 RepID=A0A5C1AGZ3_9BACT|nr:circularly permuted type 2 ATP-grasp protein [Limnoglobus roseus]QEL17905.1 circularly permuted type 2 ATP-grasp protein [Limnoglobus roseus]